MTRRILIIDDDAQVVTLAGKVVETLGHEAVPFTDPFAAREHIENNFVDLALVDLMMPDMDGFELTSWIRKNNQFVRVINMTGFAPVNTLLGCWRLGSDCCVLKGPAFVPSLKDAVQASIAATDRWEASVDAVRKSSRINRSAIPQEV